MAHSAAVPVALTGFARSAVLDALRDPLALQRVLGEYLSEPKGHVHFEGGASGPMAGVLTLDRRTRMLYDSKHIFINGKSFSASGADARAMRLSFVTPSVEEIHRGVAALAEAIHAQRS